MRYSLSRCARIMVELADPLTLPSVHQFITLFWCLKEELFILFITISTISIVLYHTAWSTLYSTSNLPRFISLLLHFSFGHIYIFIVNYFDSCGNWWKAQWWPAGRPLRSFWLRVSSGTRFCWDLYLPHPLAFYKREIEVGRKREWNRDGAGIVVFLFTSTW